MSKTLRKTLNLGLAVVMLASVGASATNAKVSARHIRTHQIYRHHHINYAKRNRIRHRNHRIRNRKRRRYVKRRKFRRNKKIRRISKRNYRIRNRKARHYTRRIAKTKKRNKRRNSSKRWSKPAMSASDQTDQIVPMQNSSEINHQTKLFDYFAVQNINHDREQAGFPAFKRSAKLDYYAKKLIYPEGNTDLKYAFQGPFDFTNEDSNPYIDEWGIDKKLPNWGQNTECVITTKPNSDYYGNNGKSAADIYENDERDDHLSSYQDGDRSDTNTPTNITNPNFGHVGFAGLYVPDQGYDAVALFSK